MALKFKRGRMQPSSGPVQIQGLQELASLLSQARIKATAVKAQDPSDKNMRMVLESIEKARTSLGAYLSGE